MDKVTPFTPLDGGRGRLALHEVEITEADIAPATAAFVPRWTARRIGGAKFRAANDAVLRQARELLARRKRQERLERRVVEGFEGGRAGSVGLDARTPTRPETGWGLGWRSLVTASVFVPLRVLLIAVTIGLIAIVVRASDYSVDLSESWPLALAYSFPVLMVSYVLSCVADAFDTKAAKRRVALAYTAIGTALILGWVVALSATFGFDAGGAADAFTFDLGATEPGGPAEVGGVLGGVSDALEALFQDNPKGSLLLLLHVLGDVFVGAAAGTWAKLAFLAGRPAVFALRHDHEVWRAELDAARARLDALGGEVAHLEGLIRGHAAGLAAARVEAGAVLVALLLRRRAERDMAHSTMVEGLRKAG